MDIRAQLDAFPLPAQRGILSDIDKAATEAAIEALLAHPEAAAKALAGALIDPGTEGNDIRARHAMHAVAIRVAARDEAKRAAFSEGLAAALMDERPPRVKAFLIRQLQLCGKAEVAEAIGAFLTVEELADDAAQALIAIGAPGPFRAALPKVADNPALRRNLVHGLAQLADEASKGAFSGALADEDDEIRLLALWGLVQLGDATTLDAFLAAEAKETGFARTKAAGLCLQFAEKLPPEDAAKVYAHLRATRTTEAEAYLLELLPTAE